MSPRKHLLIIVCLCFILTSCNIDDDINDNADVKPGIVIKVGGIDEIEPYFYEDKDNKFKGYNVDVMNAIAKEAGIEVEYKKVYFDDAIEALESGYVDIILGVHQSSIYRDNLVSSNVFIRNSFNIFVKLDNNSIQNISDLSNKKISVCKTDPAYAMFKDRKDMKVFVCETQKTAYNLLKNSVVDAYVANKEMAFNYIDDPFYRKTVKIVGGNINIVPTGAISLKEKDYLIQMINETLEIVQEKGILDRLRTKWFGEKITDNPEFLYKVIAGIVIVSIALLLIILIIIRFNKALKDEVNLRTMEIQKSAKFKEEIMDSIFECLLTLDNDLIVTSTNKRLRESMLFEGDLTGQNIKDTELIEIIDVEDINEVLTGNSKIIDREKCIDKSGVELFIEYNVTAININDEINGITITFKDITEEKVMMKKIISKDKMESLGRLTAGIAHEIRNPLTCIDMYIKLLPERIDEIDFRLQMTEDITKEINRLNNLIKNLLDYSRPLPSKKEIFIMNEEMVFILRLLKTEIDKYNIDVTNSIDDETSICFDKQQFKQIMINIIINAIEAMEDMCNPKIDIGCKVFDGYIELHVYNNGQPINCEDIEKIFEPFFTTKNYGCGLGLSIVSQLCKENDSEIFLSENDDSGVQFTISIRQSI